MSQKILSLIIICILLSIVSPSVFSAELPPQAQADHYLLAGMKKYKCRNFKGAVADFNKIAALKARVDDSFYYYFAKSLRGIKEFSKGKDAVTAYISKSGIGGKFYRDALELLVDLEEDIGRQTELAKREEVVSLGVNDFMLTIPKKGKPHPALVERLNGMKFAWVGPGCYEMGEKTSYGPVHEVCVDGFYMGIHEVSQEQWRIIMGKNPSRFNDCANCPVENISWEDVQHFIKTLNRKSGARYRLPTEAEWEYAARSGGKKQKFAGGSEVDELAWYNSNSGSETHPVGQKKPNQLGLYDMSGNVWEWCSDLFASDYYRLSPVVNPKGAEEGTARVVRGGSWYLWHQFSETTTRHKYIPSYKYGYLGVRLVRDGK